MAKERLFRFVLQQQWASLNDAYASTVVTEYWTCNVGEYESYEEAGNPKVKADVAIKDLFVVSGNTKEVAFNTAEEKLANWLYRTIEETEVREVSEKDLALVAQRTERQTSNLYVEGSSPSGGVTKGA